MRYHCDHAAAAPVEVQQRTFADLFAGAGGLSLGFEQAGFVPTFALDVDPWFMATYRYNRPDLVGRTEFLACDLLEWLKEDPHPRTIDVLVGGVPCQPFSNANRQRSHHDPRRNLFQSFFDAVPRFQPKVLMIENVAGFRTHSQEVLDLFEDAGFVAAERELEAAAFGLPQSRRRLVFIAFSLDHYADAKDRLRSTLAELERRGSGLYQSTVLADAIQDLPSLTASSVPYRPDYESADVGFAMSMPKRSTNISRYVRRIHVDGELPTLLFNHKARFNNARDIEIFSLLRPGEDSRASQIQHLMPYVSRSHIFVDKYYKLRPDRLSRTITAHMRYDCNTYIHPEQARGLTAREAARIQSFPDDYIFLGTFQRIYQQVGNAVPPLVAREIAVAISKGLEP